MTSKKDVGARLKRWRKLNKLRLVDVSELIDVSQGSLSDLENGNSYPSAQTLMALALQGVNLHELLGVPMPSVPRTAKVN